MTITTDNTLLKKDISLSLTDLQRYLRFPFTVPAGTTRLDVRLRYSTPGGHGRMYPLLFSPTGFRGFNMTRTGVEQKNADFWLATDSAAPGSHPGAIEAGSWELLLDPLAFREGSQLELTILADASPREVISPAAFPEDVTVKPAAGWYRGELHSHTHHSDGNDTTAQLAASAGHHDLDFLALTDHFTNSGWSELGFEQTREGNHTAFIRGIELTSHLGHANLLGLTDWVDVLSDDPERSINDVFDDVHAQGGIVSVNHAYSNTLGWQRHDTDWRKVDVLEIYHHLEFEHNILQLAFWDQLLNRGFAIKGISATDSHNAWRGRHRLGQNATVVYADTLSERDIIAGLKRGQVYASLGASLDFYAESDNQRVAMFESLPLGSHDFYLKLEHVDRPAVVFVLKNGLYYTHFDVSPGQSDFTWQDTFSAPGYMRVELHALPLQSVNPSRRFRTWDSFLAASNPIFAGATFKDGRWY